MLAQVSDFPPLSRQRVSDGNGTSAGHSRAAIRGSIPRAEVTAASPGTSAASSTRRRRVLQVERVDGRVRAGARANASRVRDRRPRASSSAARQYIDEQAAGRSLRRQHRPNLADHFSAFARLMANSARPMVSASGAGGAPAGPGRSARIRVRRSAARPRARGEFHESTRRS